MSEKHTLQNIVDTIIALAFSSQNNETLAKWVSLHDIGVALAFAHRDQMITGFTPLGEQVLRDAISNLASALETTEDHLVQMAISDDDLDDFGTMGSQDGRWEDPNLFDIALKSVPAKSAYAARTSDSGILKRLMGDDSVVSAVASNPSLAYETGLLGQFIEVAVSHHFARYSLVENSHLPPEIFESLAASTDANVRAVVARRAQLSEEALKRLVKDENSKVREAVAENPNLTGEMVAVLAKDEVPEVRRGAGTHPRASGDVLEALATDDDKTARSGAARNPSLFPELIVALLNDEDSSVRLWAARNPSLTGAELTALAAGDDVSLREAVGANPGTPLEVLETLAGDTNWRVRQSVAGNARASATLLTKLSEDSNFLVRQNMASNPNLPPDIIERLARDRSWETRELIAANPSCPPVVLATLARDVYPDVRIGVLSNLNTSIDTFKEVLDRLAQEAQAEDESLENDGNGDPRPREELGTWESVALWPKLTTDDRQAILPSDVDSLELMWREYFECWSTDGSFEDSDPFEPLELGTELNVPGAAELLERVQGFDISGDVEDSRERFEQIADEFVEWVTRYLPIVPAEFEVSGSFWLENTEENRQKLRSMDPHHIWSVIWGDVLYLMESFEDSSNDEKVVLFCVTDQPHIADGTLVCDLTVRISCMLCDGEGYSSDGDACPACEEGGQAVVHVEHFAAQRLVGLIPRSIRALTGWLS